MLVSFLLMIKIYCRNAKINYWNYYEIIEALKQKTILCVFQFRKTPWHCGEHNNIFIVQTQSLSILLQVSNTYFVAHRTFQQINAKSVEKGRNKKQLVQKKCNFWSMVRDCNLTLRQMLWLNPSVDLVFRRIH